MRKGNVPEAYRFMFIQDKRTFRVWLVGNIVISSLFAGMLIAMAAMGGLPPTEGMSAQAAMASAAR